MRPDEDEHAKQGTPRSRAAPRDYKVGYGKPPKATQFGARPQPQRASGRGAGVRERSRPDIAALLNQPIEVKRNGKRSRVHSHVAMLHGLFARAMTGEIRALKQFLTECARAGLLDAPHALGCAVIEAPRDMPIDLAGYIIRQEGLPPWRERLMARYRAEYEADLAHIAKLKEEALAEARANGENVY